MSTTAQIIDQHRAAKRWVGHGVTIECPCGHESKALTRPAEGPLTEDRNSHRDADRLHAQHVADALAAQEPTDAECIHVLSVLGTDLGQPTRTDFEWSQAAIRRCRAALIDAKEARRG